jgi:hypothetical protein
VSVRWLTLVALCLACTDAKLYDATRPPIEANRVALTGRVCTDDAAAARFPIRLVVVADQSAGPLFADYDAGGERIRRLRELVQSALSRPAVSVAIVGYGGRAARLAPETGAFSRSPGELLNAITRLSLPEGCLAERCRDYGDGLRAAGAIIEDDVATLSAGERVLTQYVVLLLNAGPADPLARGRDCCAVADRACIDAGGPPSFPCQAQLDVGRVQALERVVAESGAAGLTLHTVQLAADEDLARRDGLALAHDQMAFAGGGRSLRFEAAAGLDFTALGLFDRATALRAKRLVVANVNAVPSPDGPVPDSDGDGLSDAAEIRRGTDPIRADSDDDGVGDLVEGITGFDPQVADRPPACEALPPGDADADGLSNCDEALLGTDASLIDTDGDGLPDRLELALGTDYLTADGLGDLDQDGVPNGDEVRGRTDPRTADHAAQLGQAYRYTEVDEGLVTEPVADPLETLNGVEVVEISPGTTAGVGLLTWAPGPPATLSWQDAADGTPGAPVPVVDGALVELPSSSYAPIQGDDGRRLRVRIRRAEAPTRPQAERLRIVRRERQCLQWTVRNIRLVETLPLEGESAGGLNALWIYFGQAPAGRPAAPGPFRLARVPVRYLAPDFRDPGGARLEVAADEFVSPRPGQ